MEFGNLIPGKLCNLEGNYAFGRKDLAILRDNWSFLEQECDGKSSSHKHLTIEGSFGEILGKCCI